MTDPLPPADPGKIAGMLGSVREAAGSVGSMFKDSFIKSEAAPNAGFKSGAVTTVGTLAFAKGAYDTIRKTGEMIGMVDPGVDESGKKKEAASLVSTAASAALAAAGAYAIVKGASMGRGA
jgi:hypothetical protein